jgi:cyclophilin family peptidyl-prolyl cis-trans isomerase
VHYKVKKGCFMPAKRYNAPHQMQIETNRTYHVVIKTNKGDIHLELNPAEAPMTVNNFVALARDGYYDGVTFHRVVPRFVIQGGDPTGTGSGGPGYQFQDEAVNRPYKAGTVAMANAGPNTNGSQFFICLEDQPGLPPNYTIFGDTVTGMDVVRNIRVGDVMQSVTIE